MPNIVKVAPGADVTFVSHDSERRTYVKGHISPGSYSRNIHYTGASLSQLASLTRVTAHCDQLTNYECYGSGLLTYAYGSWVSRDSARMTYWDGASPGGGKCTCG